MRIKANRHLTIDTLPKEKTGVPQKTMVTVGKRTEKSPLEQKRLSVFERKISVGATNDLIDSESVGYCRKVLMATNLDKISFTVICLVLGF
jgi:hypothetical protein